MTKPSELGEQVLVIGPARSGTKLVRDVIASHPEISKIPYDINFIWRRFNEPITHDALDPSLATPEVIQYLHKYFASKNSGTRYVIEKTVSNVIRMPFVSKVFPNAKLIFLVRNGMDTVASVHREWGRSPGASYLAKKMLSVPMLDIVPYALGYAADLVANKLSIQSRRKYVWGVRYPGFESDLEAASVLEFCARQWDFCAEKLLIALDEYPDDSRLFLKYEDFVTDPDTQLTRIADYLELSDEFSGLQGVHANSVGGAKKQFDQADYELVSSIIKSNQIRLKYLL